MTLCAVGINHNTAPLTIREQLAIPGVELKSALLDLRHTSKIEEAVILSTCNRTELYCGIAAEQQYKLIDWIGHYYHLSHDDFTPYLYAHHDQYSIRHIFRVACGLDSMILGEPQILGQMKSAYRTAHEAGTLGKYLNQLFQCTFSTAKKVRTDTAIGCSPISIAYAAVRLAQQIFSDLKQQTALLIGAGETIELTARHLHDHHIGHLMIANRTYPKAAKLAAQFNGRAIPFAELVQSLADADIIVSSTASAFPILGKGSVESAIKTRKHKPIFMVDLAVPRDIEPEVEQLSDVYLYTVDDLQNTLDENLKSRREAARQAEKIIDSQVEQFMAWLRSEGATITVREYREAAYLMRDEALAKALTALKKGTPPQDALQLLAHNLTHKLIHHPSVELKRASANQREDLIAAARQLFNLQ